jgi:hypothetical protein
VQLSYVLARLKEHCCIRLVGTHAGILLCCHSCLAALEPPQPYILFSHDCAVNHSTSLRLHVHHSQMQLMPATPSHIPTWVHACALLYAGDTAHSNILPGAHLHAGATPRHTNKINWELSMPEGHCVNMDRS